MKVITLWQPWASLIIEDKKHIETRSWATSYRGPIGIHAAQKPVNLWATTNFQKYGIRYNSKELPLGVILGYTELIECIQITEAYSAYVKKYMPMEYAFGDYTPGRWAWLMDGNPVKLPEPIPAKGMQRIWEYDIPVMKGSVSEG